MIYVYGGSNVAGWRPDAMKLYNKKVAWPKQLETLLNVQIRIDGQPGRSLVQTGNTLEKELQSFQQFTKGATAACTLILMIGLNDFPQVNNGTQVIDYLNSYIAASGIHDVYYIVHPGIQYSKVPESFKQFQSVSQIEKHFMENLDKINAKLIRLTDTSIIGEDGIHFNEAGHKQISMIVYKSITGNQLEQ